MDELEQLERDLQRALAHVRHIQDLWEEALGVLDDDEPETTTPFRCGSMKIETVGRRRSWRCQLAEGHDGRHKSVTGHRNWD